MKKKKSILSKTASTLNGVSQMHQDLLTVYKEQLRIVDDKLSKAEALYDKLGAEIQKEQSASKGFGVCPLKIEMRNSLVSYVASLLSVKEMMEELTHNMDTFRPEDWAASILDAKKSVTDVKEKFPKYFKGE